ncbi:hypothetical protein BASA81_008880 [Batrachochytrium salamandrivorans]|nr:hypothetical protein BASA81_008880 [Batrachochytrium salamandrivorans]
MLRRWWSSSPLETCTSLLELESIISYSPKLRAKECSLAIFKLSKLQSRNQKVIAKVLEEIKGKKFKPRNLANMCHAIAKGRLAHKIPSSLETAVAGINLMEWDSQQMSNLVWSFAKLGQFELFDRFAIEVTRRGFAEFQPQGISNILWGFAERGEPVLEMLAKLDQVLVTEFKPVDVANVFWALAVLQQQPPTPQSSGILPKLAELVVEQPNLNAYSTQALCNILWSCAKLQIRDAKLLRAICKELEARDMLQWTPQDFANIVWSLGKLNHVPLFLGNISTLLTVSHLLQRFSTEALASLLLGFALCSHKSCCSAIADALASRTTAFTPHTIASLLWSFDQLSFKPTRVCRLLSQQALLLLPNFTNQDLAQLAIGFAKLDYRDDVLLQAVAVQVSTRTPGTFSNQALLNVLWSFACLDALSLSEVHKLFMQHRLVDTNDYNHVQAQQLVQTLQAWKQSSNGKESPLLHSLAHKEWYRNYLLIPPPPSQTHLDVSRVLAQKFPELSNEYPIADGVFVDIFLPSLRMAVEIDGPTHFFHNTLEPTGTTRFKHRLVRGSGVELKTFKTRELLGLSPKQFAEKIVLI